MTHSQTEEPRYGEHSALTIEAMSDLREAVENLLVAWAAMNRRVEALERGAGEGDRPRGDVRPGAQVRRSAQCEVLELADLLDRGRGHEG